MNLVPPPGVTPKICYSPGETKDAVWKCCKFCLRTQEYKSFLMYLCEQRFTTTMYATSDLWEVGVTTERASEAIAHTTLDEVPLLNQ